MRWDYCAALNILTLDGYRGSPGSELKLGSFCSPSDIAARLSASVTTELQRVLGQILFTQVGVRMLLMKIFQI